MTLKLTWDGLDELTRQMGGGAWGERQKAKEGGSLWDCQGFKESWDIKWQAQGLGHRDGRVVEYKQPHHSCDRGQFLSLYSKNPIK